MKLIKSIIFALFLSAVCVYAQEQPEQKNTYVFIDISGSMTPIFPQVRDYVKDTVIPAVPLNSELHIFKFYKKLVPIFNRTIRSDTDKEYAAQRVGLLLSNGPWTDLDNIFAYLNEHQLNSENAIIYICTDGYEQLENYSQEYRITADSIRNYAADMELEDKNGWLMLTWKRPDTAAVVPIKPETEKEEITFAAAPIESKQNIHITLPVLIIFFIVSIILIILSLLRYFSYKKEIKKSIPLTQLETVKKNAEKCFIIIGCLFTAELICFIACIFFSAVLFYATVLQLAYSILSLMVDGVAVRIIWMLYRKQREIQSIYKNLLAEAEKYDRDIGKDITPESVAEITDSHEQLVMGIICLKDIEFNEKTKLNTVDKGFMLFTVALQCIRQYILTPFQERKGDQELANEIKEGVGKPELDENGKPKTLPDFIKDIAGHEEHSNRGYKYYNPSLNEIITNPVPFDTIQRGEGVETDIAQHGGHRYTTLGHDPLLGWIFGTANIATATLTDYKFQSWHVRTGTAYQRHGKDIKTDMLQERADTGKIFYYTQRKLIHEGMEGREKIAAALIKEAIHLKSDSRTPKGLPIPIISPTLGPEFAAKLAKYGIDAENVLTVGKQWTTARFINDFIAMIHRLTLDPEAENEKLFMVRTKKIINYSTYIAEGSNVLVTALIAYCHMRTDKKPEKALKYLDIGGIINGIITVLSNRAIIRRIKIDFILNRLDEQREESAQNTPY